VAANDCIIENLTAANTVNVVGPHQFVILAPGDRTILCDCDFLSEGADTVSLARGASGHYFISNCYMRGAADFLCPRGWCYVVDSTFFQVSGTAAVWIDGSKDRDMKLVLRNCKFDGAPGWNLARHHRDGMFFFIDCTFSKTMADRAPYRVLYPLNGGAPTDADKARNADLDRTNIWGERSYFYNCHRDGGDFAWHANNLDKAPGTPTADQITAKWTFAGKWDPESEVHK
jgi:pectinesterase